MIDKSIFAILLASWLLWHVHSGHHSSYGLDCSWPIFETELTCGDQLGDREGFYHDYINGCRENIGSVKKAFICDETEDERLAMNERQPRSMVNYSDIGFMKTKAPKEVMDLIVGYWETNQEFMTEEKWPTGSIYLNYWESKTYMVAVQNSSLKGGGGYLQDKIWDAARTSIEDWTGMELQPTSLYGIRVYTEGAVLNPHVDRLPLVSSCIINVAQDVDEPWPLEVYDRQGRAVNVTMEPGDMVLYESASTVHGRPFPLKGRSYANVFIHFEPTGRPLSDTTDAWREGLDDFLPPYLIPESDGAEHWILENPDGWSKPSPSVPLQNWKPPDGHYAAAIGDFDRLSELAEEDPDALHRKDPNGWQPIHEAVRGGFTDVVKLLVENGSSVDARTGHNDEGQSALNLSLSEHGEDHPVSIYLSSLGARDIAFGEL